MITTRYGYFPTDPIPFPNVSKSKTLIDPVINRVNPTQESSMLIYYSRVKNTTVY